MKIWRGSLLFIASGFVGAICWARTPVQPFPLEDVRLLEGYSKDQQDLNVKYLLTFDLDRLLYNFRVNAGLPAPGKPYGGWEAPDCEVRGHFVGHYLSACALSYASTGNPELKRRADTMVKEFGKCQDKLGQGYLSAFPTSFWDRTEKLEKVPWAPYYTIHKIMAGLLDAYTYCRNKQALKELEGMAGYFETRIDKIPQPQWERVLNVEYGGMSDVLYNLYAVTQKPEYRALAHKFDKQEFLVPLSQGRDNLAGRHGNTHIPIVIGAARNFELTGDQPSKQAALYFWDQVVNHHSYATGGSTNGEVWGPADHLEGSLSVTNHEVCKTYNMLKLTRQLFCWNPDPKYTEFYERALINGIWGTHQPKTGLFEYYVPQITGAYRRFGSPEGAFWCCFGSGVENWSKLNDSIYFRGENSLYVNLFISSQLQWREKGMTVTQKTTFPESDRTSLSIQTRKPVSATIKVRIPAWTHDARLSVNGASIKGVKSGQYVSIKRTWKTGDRIDLTLPMSLRSVPLLGDPETVAVAYGPMVLAGIVKRPNTERPTTPNADNAYADALPPSDSWILSGNPLHPSEWLTSQKGKGVEFELPRQKIGMAFKPFYQVENERYGLYWLVVEPGSARDRQMKEEKAALEALKVRTIDEVEPEMTEVGHYPQGEKTSSGPYGTTHYRDAQEGGWFSWDLKVVPDQQMTLVVRYWGSDVPPRTFDILVDGVKVAKQSLDRLKPGKFVDVEYLLPQELTRTKSKVTVKFAPHPGNIAGGVFYVRMLKP